MTKFFLFIVLTLGSNTVLFAADCPLGKDETELTLTRVMLNFGRYTRNADFVSTVGSGAADAVKETQLDSALADLPVAIVCAQAAIDSTSLEMLPAAAKNSSSEVQKAFSDKLKMRMAEFKITLEAYLTELSLQKSLALESRNYDNAYEITSYIKEWVGNVHEELTVN